MAAAITSVDQITDGFYVFRNVGHGTFLRETKSESDNQLFMGRVSSSNDYANFKEDFIGLNKFRMAYVTYIHKQDDGTFTIQFQSGKYMPSKIVRRWTDNNAYPTGNNVSSETAGNVEFGLIDGTDDHFWFKPVGCELYADAMSDEGNSEGKFCAYSPTVPTSSAVNSSYQLYRVELASLITCSWTATDGTNTVATGYSEAFSGGVAPNPFTEAQVSCFYTNPQVQETDLTVSETNKDFHVIYQKGSNMPFELSTESNPKWYRVYFNKNQNLNLMYYGNANNRVDTKKGFTSEVFNGVETQDSYSTFNGALWAFISGENGGIKLFNKQTRKYISLNEDGTYPGYNQDYATLSDNPQLFTVLENSAGGFSLCEYGVKHACMGDHLGGTLGVWYSSNDETWNNGSSCWNFIEADTDPVLSVGKSLKQVVLQNLLAAETGDCAAAATTEEIQASLNQVQNATSIAALDEVTTRWIVPYFEDDAYYLVRNVNWNDDENAYITTNGMKVNASGHLDTSFESEKNRNVRRATGNGALVPRLWKVEKKSEGNYWVRNANNGCCLSVYKNSGMEMDMPINQSDGGYFSIKTTQTAFSDCHSGKTNDELSMFQLIDNTSHLRIGAREADGNVLGGTVSNSDADASNYWQFVKVNTVPVTIGETGWASLALPFETTIPEGSHVKAYYAKNVANSELTLKEVPNGVIPANQGVLLVNDEVAATTVDLAITHNGAVLDGDNQFTAATARRAGIISGTTYVLAKKQDGNVAFLKSTLQVVPENRAYLEASRLTSTNGVLNFRFAEVTGIEDAAVSDNGQETYYDLNGRVVLYPVHGVFVTASGKKVYVK